MTPEMVQAVKILQLEQPGASSLVRDELLNNPVLEAGQQRCDDRNADSENAAEREDREEEQELINDYIEDGELTISATRSMVLRMTGTCRTSSMPQPRKRCRSILYLSCR